MKTRKLSTQIKNAQASIEKENARSLKEVEQTYRKIRNELEW